uniref:Neural cell adhesion molecule L1 n=1 Tax=Astatotilapia calliptera TaxID=8154 RepID=A0AAX7UA66_ASTCA
MYAVKRPPVIKTQPESVTVFSTEDFVMNCEASGNPSPIFRWAKDGEDFDPGSDPELKVSESSGSFAFYTLSNTMDTLNKYKGKYVCYASNELGTAVSNEAILNTDGKSTSTTHKKVDETADEGKSFILKCNPPQSSMEPIIHWMDLRLRHIDLSKRVMAGKDGNLYFANLESSDSRDDYTCNVQYLATRTILAKEPTSLKVTQSNSVLRNRRPQMMRPTGHHSTYHALRGQTLDLECIPSILPLSETRTTKDMFDRRLRFTNISESDGGEYQCIAENSQGNTKHIYMLTVEAAPYWIKEPVSQLYAPGETVRLDCQADGIPSPIISWTINGVPISGVDKDPRRTLTASGSLILEDVNFGDTAIYQCRASNKHGTILTNTNVYVIELPPQILTDDGNTYAYTEGQKALLECETFDRPDPPILLQISDPKDRTVTLSWTPGDDHNGPVTEYVVEFEDHRSNESVWKMLARVSGNKERAVLSLWPFMSYRFRIIAINDVGKSDPSKPSGIYNTPAEAPDNNPKDVKSESIEPNTLVISWKKMNKTEVHGPGFKYCVQWRQAVGGGPDWHEKNVTEPPFRVDNVGNFSAYEIKVQAFNEIGRGPEPDTVIGYSGEDVPLEAPMDVGVEIINSTTIKVTWAPIDKDTVRGHLLGYKVLPYHHRGRRAQELESTVVVKTEPNEKKKVISDLRPFSNYTLKVTVYNIKGEGPFSEALPFETPEGVPGPPLTLTLDSPSETEMTLHWTPPGQPNGVLIGYLLQYQQSDDDSPMQVETIDDPTVTHITLKNLDHKSHYRFYLRGRTAAGDGVPTTMKGATMLDGGVTEMQPSFATQGWFIGVVSAIGLLLLILLILCFIKRSKGGKYSVKDKEEGPMDSEARPMKDETFGEYSDLEEKRTASQPSLCEKSKLYSEDNLDFNGSSAMTTELNMDESLASQISRPSGGPEGYHGLPENAPLNPTTCSPATNGVPNSVTILD